MHLQRVCDREKHGGYRWRVATVVADRMVKSVHPMIDGFMTEEYLSSAEKTKEEEERRMFEDKSVEVDVLVLVYYVFLIAEE